MQDVRRLPGGDWLYQRVDAYPGVRLDRDMGAGQDADGWLAEVAMFLERDGAAAESTTHRPHDGPRARVRGLSLSGAVSVRPRPPRATPAPRGVHGARRDHS